MAPSHHHAPRPGEPTPGTGGAGHDHGGLRGRLLGWLRPHAHGAAEQLDPSRLRSREGVRATQVTLAVLVATSAVQLVIALASGSVALLADMIHNLADGLTSVPLWLAFLLGRRPANRTYPYGYRRAEDLVGVVIVLVIAASAVLVGWESLHRLLNRESMTHVWWVLLAGVVGVAGNEVAAVVRIRVGHRIGSAALVADGYHARADTMASLAVIVAAVGTWLGFPIVDPLAGLLITAVICWILVHTARDVFRRLMDGVEPAVLDTVEAAASAVEGVQRIDAARARWIGHRLQAEVAVTVDRDLTVAQGHALGEQVRHALLHALPHLEDVAVHVNPCGHDGTDPHGLVRHHHGPR